MRTHRNQVPRNGEKSNSITNRRKLGQLLLISTGILIAVALTGCGSKSTGDAASGGAAKSGELIGVVFDSGGLGDNSFNDSAKAGLDKAKADFGIVEKTVTSNTEKDYETNLTALADAGCKLVFAVGLNQGDALKVVAPKYPDVKFAIIDGEVSGPNVRSLRFAEEQGSFLAGYVAAKTSKTHKLGFVGGEELDLIKKFYYGYAAGAYYADHSVTVLPAKYAGSWDDVSLAAADALQLYGSGADIVYHAAGRAGQGVISTAKQQSKLAIGVDMNQDAVAPGFVLTSMVKHVDVAVYQTISDLINNKLQPGDKVYDLSSDGVGLTDFKYTKDKVPAGVLDQLDGIKKDIISGKLKVPATEAEYDAFIASKPAATP